MGDLGGIDLADISMPPAIATEMLFLVGCPALIHALATFKAFFQYKTCSKAKTFNMGFIVKI